MEVCLGEWHGQIDFLVMLMDDYSIVLGMAFMDNMKVVPITCANSMPILEENITNVVPLLRETCIEAKQLLAMQCSKGIKKRRPTFLEAPKE